MSIEKARWRLPGIHLKHQKKTSQSATVVMPPPNQVKILMSQHIGSPCSPLVKPGDIVYVGTKIGENSEKLSAPIHSSVSGVVTSLTEEVVYGGQTIPAIVIESDGEQKNDPSLAAPNIRSKEDFLKAVYESGLVGLGGAGFPGYAKLTVSDNQIDTLIINGAECEPYITSDHREFLEHTDTIMEGITQIQRWLNIPHILIGIEDNQPEALAQMEQAAEGKARVISLPSRYPQGAEKVLVYTLTKRVVPEGKLPPAVGVIVMNVTSVSKLGQYLLTGMPLVKKRLTVDGDCIGDSKNVEVPIGTSIQNIVEFCGGWTKDPKKVLCGGPMMGIAVMDLNAPIVKNNNAILAFSKEKAELPETTACIRCGRCNSVCPIRLMPQELESAYDAEDAGQLRKLHVDLCINCGCCSYVCPAKRNLAQKNQLAKEFLRRKKAE